jgi:hypothetical protein
MILAAFFGLYKYNQSKNPVPQTGFMRIYRSLNCEKINLFSGTRTESLRREIRANCIIKRLEVVTRLLPES